MVLIHGHGIINFSITFKRHILANNPHASYRIWVFDPTDTNKMVCKWIFIVNIVVYSTKQMLALMINGRNDVYD